MHDPVFLAVPSERATREDRQIAMDLLDTLRANLDGCVGMAANMIGEHKRIIVIHAGISQMAMLNPKIVQKNGAYEAEEGCLSLAGVRKTTRYQSIVVEYQDIMMKKQKEELDRQRTALNNANLRLNELLQQVEALEQKILNKE